MKAVIVTWCREVSDVSIKLCAAELWSKCEEAKRCELEIREKRESVCFFVLVFFHRGLLLIVHAPFLALPYFTFR